MGYVICVGDCDCERDFGDVGLLIVVPMLLASVRGKWCTRWASCETFEK